jgi:diguanylate cyclase (GGDEF)-like protein
MAEHPPSPKENISRFLLTLRVEEGKSSYLERVRVLALYIIFVAAWAGGIYNFILNWHNRDFEALGAISIFLFFITLGVAAFWKTRTLRASQWLIALAVLILITHIVINAGGGVGLGVFYLLAATPVFFLTLGFRNSLFIAILYFVGMAVRLQLGHFNPESLFHDPAFIQRTMVILGIGSFLGVFSTLGLQFYHTRINHLAYQDQLTLLANRYKFEEVLIGETLNARKQHQGFTLLGIKLLNYNSINANLSTRKGDEIIRETADRLKGVLHNSVITGRWSGSLFLTLVSTVELDELQNLCLVIKEIMEKPVQIERSSINLPFSLAVCRFPEDAVSPGQLLSNMMSIFDRGGISQGRLPSSMKNS